MTLEQFVEQAIEREVRRQLDKSIEGQFTHARELEFDKIAEAALSARKQWHRATDPSIKG